MSKVGNAAFILEACKIPVNFKVDILTVSLDPVGKNRICRSFEFYRQE